jgi:hypothetical protein
MWRVPVGLEGINKQRVQQFEYARLLSLEAPRINFSDTERLISRRD